MSYSGLWTGPTDLALTYLWNRITTDIGQPRTGNSETRSRLPRGATRTRPEFHLPQPHLRPNVTR